MNSGIRGALLFSIVFMLMASAFALDIDSSVEKELNTKGYAEVIIFIDAPLQTATQNLLNQESIDSATLQKILREKKAVIKKQQSDVLREMELGTTLDSDTDLILDEKYNYINGFSGTLTKEGYEKLKYEDAVIGIYANEKLQIMLDTATPFVRAPFAETILFNNTEINGSGIGICVIDTGADTTHASLQGTIVDQYCYCSQGTGCCPNGLTEDTSAEDDNGHGTGVIGTIVSQDPIYRGIAPGAHVMVVKAFSSTGSATTSDVIAGIGKCLEKAAEYNIKVFSFSFGGSNYDGTCDDDALASITNDLVNMGFVVAAASGNNGDATHISTPACGSNVTSVGAVYDNSSTSVDTVVSFSNAHAELDLLAPGVWICTTKAQKSSGSICYTGANGGIYKTYSGTSFSTPLVAGAAAVIAQYKQQESQNTDPASIINDLKQYGQPVLDARNGLLFPRLDIENTLKHIDHTAPLITINETNVSKHFTITAAVSDAVNDIVLCKLSLNGINETMNLTGSGRNVACSIEKDIMNTTTYIIYALDNNSNIAYAEHALAVTNTLPVINTYSPNSTIVSLQNNESVIFFINATDTDEDTLSYNWILNGTTVASEQTYNFSASAGLYYLEGIVSDGIEIAFVQWNITVTELIAPVVSNIQILPTTAYRNENLTCNYTYFDANNDTEISAVIQWYLNDTFNRNATYIASEELIIENRWNCSVTASDGTLFSNTSYSPSIIIQNHAPEIAAEDVLVYETEQIIINYSTYDADNDTVTVTINDTQFENFVMNTTIDSAGSFAVLLTATDEYDSTKKIVLITIYDALDSDNDGVADIYDEDDDNDGVADAIDKINGTVEGYELFINNNTESNTSLEGEHTFALKDNGKKIVEFTYNLDESLQLWDAAINSVNNSEGNIVITGLDIESKTAYIDALNTSVTGVCIQDVENPSEITALCTGLHETFVPCNGTVIEEYTCSAISGQYMITGLEHSAIMQKCIDADKDGYGLGCIAGNDCNDENAAISPAVTEINDNGVDDNCDGISATTPAPVQTATPPVTTTAAAGGAGGGGAGPNIFEEEIQETETIVEEQNTVSESAIPEEHKEENKEPIILEETLVESIGLVDITGAAISDISAGRFTLNVFGLIVVILMGCSLLFSSGYYAIKHKRIHEKIDFFNPKEGITIIYEGIKDLFKK